MHNLPLVSIAVCTFNGEKFLDEQIRTVINQTYRNKEILVIDDHSTDNTYSILKKYEAEGSIKLFRNEKNLGFVKNFEKAISLCKGDYIALCDQDDIWDLKKIETQVNLIGDNLLTYHDSDLIDHAGNSLKKKMSDHFRFVETNQSMSFIFHNCVSGHSMLFKRELIKYIFPIPENFFHDWWMTYVATTIGSINYSSHSYVKYRQHANSTTDVLNIRGAIDGQNGTKISNPKEREERTEKIISILTIFSKFLYNKKENQYLLDKLKKHYIKKKSSYFFCFGLYFTLLKNRKILFFIDKTATNKKMDIFKESIGDQLKNTFHYYKKRIFKFRFP